MSTSQATRFTVPRHVPSLDGLRAIAVLLVLWCHVPRDMPGYPTWLALASFWAEPGELGVELFFALSGFLITRILINERDGGVPVRWFLLRRLLRIFPIYYLLLAVMLWSRPANEIGWCALYLGNVGEVFAPPLCLGPLAHTWSLCVEEHFYLLWPLVVAFTQDRTARRVLTFVVIPLAVLGALVTSLSLPIEVANLAITRLSPIRFLTLACGALVAFAETGLIANPRALTRRGLGLAVAGLALQPSFWFVVLPVALLQVQWWPIELGATVTRLHMALLSTGILMLCLAPSRTGVAPQRLLTTAPLRGIGRISYGLYLYHLPLFQALLYAPATPTGPRVALALLLTLAAATLSYWLIERPILRYAARFRHRGA
ncbi:MAG: acyltransferase [Planctomycetes bacterium]|nr:acyltransferase [Planctomycetota bacterium]MCC7398898.1 acyltransferase [Planctomycetota bacterium]